MAKHHYVPQFYLKKFCDTAIPAGHDPFVWVNDGKSRDWKKKSPKNCGYEIDLYSVPGAEREVVEKFYSLVESMMANTYRACLDTYNFPVGEQREAISLFAGCCATRSPMSRWNHERNATEMLEHSIKMIMKGPGFLDRLATECAYDRNEAERLHRLVLEKGGYKVSVKKEYLTGVGVKMVPMLTDIINKMKWKLLIAPQGEYFITTDSPANWEDPTFKHSFFSNSGFAFKNVEFILPLSRKLCLLAGWNYMEGVFLATPGQVRQIINRCITWSAKQIYSPTPFELVKLDKANNQPIKVFNA